MTNITGPSAFVGGQGGSFYDTQQRIAPIAPAPVTQRPPAPPAPAEPARLVLKEDGMCLISKAMFRALGIRASAYVRLVAPAQRGGQWYLDTKPKDGDGRRLTDDPSSGVYRFRNPVVGRLHFTKSLAIRRGTGERIAGSVVVALTQLAFVLGPEHADHPGYYLLLPAPGLRPCRFPG